MPGDVKGENLKKEQYKAQMAEKNKGLLSTGHVSKSLSVAIATGKLQYLYLTCNEVWNGLGARFSCTVS